MARLGGWVLVSMIGVFRVEGFLARLGGWVLVTRIAFFRVRGLALGRAGRVLVSRIVFFRVGGFLARLDAWVLVSKIACFRVGQARFQPGRVGCGHQDRVFRQRLVYPVFVDSESFDGFVGEQAS